MSLKTMALPIVVALTLSPAALRAQGPGAPPSRAARLSYVYGRVSFLPSGDTSWVDATLNYTITTGDRLYTDQGSRSELEVGPAALRLAAETDVTVTNLTDQLIQMGINQGTIRLSVYDLLPGDSIELDTPNGALTLLRAGNYRVEVRPNDDVTLVTVDDGTLEVTGGGQAYRVRTGRAVRLVGDAQQEEVAMAPPTSFDDWSGERDRHYASSTSVRYVSRDIPGYDELDDHGRWEDLPDGPVWYPTDVPPGWVPYRYGRWSWVEPWGWTWIEEERWGYAPFHYGRWAYVGSRWGWYPGPVIRRPCYAPALVVFVGGYYPSAASVTIVEGGVQAWVPLGPREAYEPWYHHDDEYLRRVNVTNVRGVRDGEGFTHQVLNVHYVNQSLATTAVSGAVFRRGQPIGREALRLEPNEASRGRIIPHPTVVPAATAVGGGRVPIPAPRPQPRVEHEAGIASGRGAGVPGRPPVSSPPPPPSAQPPAALQQGPRPRPRPATEAGSAAEPRLVRKLEPPPANPPFAAREQAMQEHPGRPLEPQQVQRLREGRPAGPMRDAERVPHGQAPANAPPPPPAKEPSRSDKERKR
nr:hypothetical protein Hi04_10k_c554_00019 [uncultured bacterium]